jgi:hypothetical protein
MAITNNNAAIIDLPTWEVLQPLVGGAGAAATPGILCNDKRGTNRYIYYLFSATSFWRYDTYSNTYQQLASPPAGTTGAGTCMIFDPSNNYIWALISNGTAAPTWQYYNIATNIWTARSVTNLPATFGTDAALSHTCSTYHGDGNDDYIYLIGNGSTVFYRYSITGNSWINNLTATTGVNGAGCSLAWMPGWNTDRIVRIRGGATAVIDYYSIINNNWTTITYLPATETFTTGTMIATKGMAGDKIYIQKDATLRIYCLDLGDLTLTPQATEYIVATGAALVGDRMVYVIETNGIEFIYFALHTSANFLRTPIYF